MPLAALLLDLDGTLVDTNPYHVEAWLDASRPYGYEPDREAVAQLIGMGGDQLVPALLGEEAEAQHGEAMREARGEAFRARARNGVSLLPGAEALIEAARRRGLRLALCTSAETADLDAIFLGTGTDLRPHFEVITTATDVAESKPEPDVLGVALRTLGVDANETVLVGDTVFDGEAAARAGVPFVGLTTWVADNGALRQASARQVYEGPAALAADLDAVLDTTA